MASLVVAILMTLSHLQGHSLIASLFKYDLALQQLTRFQVTGYRAVSLR